jgi:hypothetical protein
MLAPTSMAVAVAVAAAAAPMALKTKIAIGLSGLIGSATLSESTAIGIRILHKVPNSQEPPFKEAIYSMKKAALRSVVKGGCLGGPGSSEYYKNIKEGLEPQKFADPLKSALGIGNKERHKRNDVSLSSGALASFLSIKWP